MDYQLVHIRRVEVKNTSFAVIDPYDRMIVRRHGTSGDSLVHAVNKHPPSWQRDNGRPCLTDAGETRSRIRSHNDHVRLERSDEADAVAQFAATLPNRPRREGCG